MKSDALFLRGKTEGVLSANRFGWNVRDEYSLTSRTFVFGQNAFLKDEFKQIDYLWAPAGGIGYRLVKTPTTTFNVDGGLGAKIEKDETDTGPVTRTDTVVAFSDKFATHDVLLVCRERVSLETR